MIHKRHSELPSRRKCERSDVSAWIGKEEGGQRAGLEAGIRTRRPGAEWRAGTVNSCCAVHAMVTSGLLKHHQVSLEQAVAIATIM